MPLADRRRLGAQGEALAADYLARAGYTILCRNWRCSLGELDLIAAIDDQLVFVEVRTRRGGSAPLESITAIKQQRLRSLAYSYLSATDQGDRLWRIDVIGIRAGANGQPSAIEHVEYAVGE